MKLLLISTFLFIGFIGFSQEEDSIYFPQEMLVHPECEEESNSNKCLENILEKQLLKIMAKPLKKGLVNKDTLTLQVSLDMGGFGYVIESRSNASVNIKNINKNKSRAFDKLVEKLPGFKVLNLKNPLDYFVSHNFVYDYLVNNATSTDKLTRINIEENAYEGGTIIQAPLFPGCIRESESKTRRCFNKKIQEHIEANFHYPEDAQRKGIQGRVSIMFTIDKNGNHTKIRSRGPHPSLVKEAERIINLLPKFEPGMANGKPTKVPFSIPINFKLR